MKASTGVKTLWSELLPHEFKRRLAECPTVYLPLGLCEPHGQISAFGLDTIKAEWLCREAAEKAGGIVAPSLGYHIHETGIHSRWLEEEVGEENPLMTAMPPTILLSFFLYQLRAFVNAGFQTIVVITGHSGGNQQDLRLAAEAFMRHIPVKVWVRSDPELVEGLYEGDHAGKYEISQLMYIRPDLIDMEALEFEEKQGSGGRLALGSNAREASPELGKEIMEACLKRICSEVHLLVHEGELIHIPKITHTVMEAIWQEVMKTASEWKTAQPWTWQTAVSPSSQWKPYEYYRAGT
jgi:creatinine amidohydrolase